MHANAKGLYFKLGAFGRLGRLASATNHGFAMPASTALVSAVQLFSVLLMLAPSVDSIVNAKVIQQLSKETELAFARTLRAELERFREFERTGSQKE